MNTPCLAVLPLLLGLIAPQAMAQSTTFLVPDGFDRTVGQELQLHVEHTRPGGAALRAAWPTETIEWFYVRVDGTQENRDRIEPAAGGDDFVPVAIERRGVTLIGLDIGPTVEDVLPQDLEMFLDAQTPVASSNDQVDRNIGQVVRVRRIQSAKLLVRTGDAIGPAGSSGTGTSKTGQESEIRPLIDPAMIIVGSDLPVRVYLPVSPERKFVTATHRSTGVTRTFQIDENGIGFFTVDRSGEWRVEVHHAEPLPGDPDADWQIHSATLVFHVAGEGGER